MIREETLRELWIVTGMLEYGMNGEILREIAERYRYHGEVPLDFGKETMRKFT